MPSIPDLLTKLDGRLGPSNFWTTQEKTYALLEAVRLWQAMTGNLTEQIAVLTSTSDVYNNTPRQYFRIIHFSIGGAEATKGSIWELDQGFPGWEGAAGAASGARYWAHNGMNQYTVYPKTATESEGILRGVNDIDRGYVGNDNLVLSAGEEKVLLDYAQHYLSFKEGQGEMEGTSDLFANFITAAGEANARLRKTNFYRASLARDRGEAQDGSKAGEDTVDWIRGGAK